MNRAATLLLTLSLPAAAAQTAPAPTTQQTIDPTTEAILRGRIALMEQSLETACPIGFSAEPGVSPGMLVIVNGDTTASQKLKLQLRHLPGPQSHPSAITGAQITAHGLTAQARITPAASDHPAASDPDDATIAKQVDLVLTLAPGHSTSADMLFQGFTSIRWLTLDSLTYADGATWHPAAHHSCRIVPNRFMAVADATTP